MTALFTREPVSDRGEPCLYGNLIFINGGSKPPPYPILKLTVVGTEQHINR